MGVLYYVSDTEKIASHASTWEDGIHLQCREIEHLLLLSCLNTLEEDGCVEVRCTWRVQMEGREVSYTPCMSPHNKA